MSIEDLRRWEKENPKRAREADRAWRLDNAEYLKEANRKWRAEKQDKEREQIRCREKARAEREAHPERTRERCRKWREAHPDRALEASRKWREQHPEKARENVRKWAARNAEHERARNALYRARARGNGGHCTAHEWRLILKKYGHRCLCCGRSDIRLTRDHVLPVESGGSGYPINLQPLCLSCNSKKNAHYIDYRPDSYFADWT